MGRRVVSPGFNSSMRRSTPLEANRSQHHRENLVAPNYVSSSVHGTTFLLVCLSAVPSTPIEMPRLAENAHGVIVIQAGCVLCTRTVGTPANLPQNLSSFIAAKHARCFAFNAQAECSHAKEVQ